MEYRTLWGSVSVAVILRLYPERVDPSDRAAMHVAVHVLGGKPYTSELDNRETLQRCQWLAIDLGAKVRIWEDKKNPRHWFLEITPSDEE
jgi:hypothetical protein